MLLLLLKGWHIMPCLCRWPSRCRDWKLAHLPGRSQHLQLTEAYSILGVQHPTTCAATNINTTKQSEGDSQTSTADTSCPSLLLPPSFLSSSVPLAPVRPYASAHRPWDMFLVPPAGVPSPAVVRQRSETCPMTDLREHSRPKYERRLVRFSCQFRLLDFGTIYATVNTVAPTGQLHPVWQV